MQGLQPLSLASSGRQNFQADSTAANPAAFSRETDRNQGSRRLMLAPVAGMVEAAILQIGTASGDLGEGGLRQNILGDIVDRAVDDLVNEADVLVFAGCDAREHLATGDFRVDDGFAAAAANSKFR
jgi:hypothetical protein